MADKYLNLVGTRRLVEKLQDYVDSKEGLGAAIQSEVLVLDTEIDPGSGGGSGGSGDGSYTLPTASASTLGGVKIGDGITITDGVISAITASAVQTMIDTAINNITDADEEHF